MNEIRYEIIITFLENADKLKKTVQSCENQILENDRIIIVGTGNLEQIKSLKEIKKYKKQIRIWGRALHRAVPAFLYPEK